MAPARQLLRSFGDISNLEHTDMGGNRRSYCSVNFPYRTQETTVKENSLSFRPYKIHVFINSRKVMATPRHVYAGTDAEVSS
jgi:hypothetical protein